MMVGMFRCSPRGQVVGHKTAPLHVCVMMMWLVLLFTTQTPMIENPKERISCIIESIMN